MTNADDNDLPRTPGSAAATAETDSHVGQGQVVEAGISLPCASSGTPRG